MQVAADGSAGAAPAQAGDQAVQDARRVLQGDEGAAARRRRRVGGGVHRAVPGGVRDALVHRLVRHVGEREEREHDGRARARIGSDGSHFGSGTSCLGQAAGAICPKGSNWGRQEEPEEGLVAECV